MSLAYRQYMAFIGTSGLTVDWTNSGTTIKAMLLTGGKYSPNFANDWYSDVSGYEFPQGNGYTLSGAIVSGRTIVENGANAFADYKANNILWVALGGNYSVSSVVVYQDTGVPTTSPLLVFLSGTDFPKVANGGDFTMAWPNGVVFRVSG